MLKIWLKFVVWTTVIGTILRFIITRITGEPFLGIMAAIYGGIEYLFFLIEMIIGGVVLGSIIFGIWYVIAGRKKKHNKPTPK